MSDDQRREQTLVFLQTLAERRSSVQVALEGALREANQGPLRISIRELARATGLNYETVRQWIRKEPSS